MPHLTLPAFAESLQEFGFRTTLVMGEGDPEKKTENVLPGIGALADADIAIFFLRFLQLPDEEWQPIQEYIESGKPVIGLRTTSHAFGIQRIIRVFHGIKILDAASWELPISSILQAQRKQRWSKRIGTIPF